MKRSSLQTTALAALFTATSFAGLADAQTTSSATGTVTATAPSAVASPIAIQPGTVASPPSIAVGEPNPAMPPVGTPSTNMPMIPTPTMPAMPTMPTPDIKSMPNMPVPTPMPGMPNMPHPMPGTSSGGMPGMMPGMTPGSMPGSQGLAPGSMPSSPQMPDHMHMMMKAPDNATPSTKAFIETNAKMHQDMAIQFTGNADADFVKGMIPHHQGAVDMANIELQYGKDPEIKKFASDIIRAQTNEINFMKNWLTKNIKK